MSENKKEKLSEKISNLSVKEQIGLYKREINKLIIQNRIGKLEKTHLIKLLKKQIARLLTIKG